MTLRDLLETVDASQMVRIIDGFTFVCDICGGLSKRNVKLVEDYLDRGVAFTQIYMIRDDDNNVVSYLSVKLDLEKEKTEVDNDSHVKIEPVYEMDVLPCTCGGGRPDMETICSIMDRERTYRVYCTKCERVANGFTPTIAIKNWNLWCGDNFIVESED